jgi:hypothetical protein
MSESMQKMNRNTPFIDYLIDKRRNNCVMEASSHIAVFIPTTIKYRQCLIRN